MVVIKNIKYMIISSNRQNNFFAGHFIKLAPLILLLFLGTTIFYSCGQNMEHIKSAPPERVVALGQGQKVIAELAASGVTDIKNNLPTVLLFSSYYCSSCREEHLNIINDIQDRNAFKDKVQFVTFLVGIDNNNKATLDGWGQSLGGLPWPIHGDLNQDLFKKHCKTNIFPCISIILPDKGSVFTSNSKVSLAEIKKYTGDWNQGTTTTTSGPSSSTTSTTTTTFPPGMSNHPSINSLNGVGEFNFLKADNTQLKVDLAANGGLGTILLFASPGCVNCMTEHMDIAKYITSWPWPKSNIYTLMVADAISAENLPDIVAGFRELSVYWPIGLDRAADSDKLFRKLCESADHPGVFLTPCTVVFDKGNNLIFSVTGQVGIEKLKEYF